MADIKTLLRIEMYKAESNCTEKYGCRNGNDCGRCELFHRSCIKGYVAERLLERFNISVKDGERREGE